MITTPPPLIRSGVAIFNKVSIPVITWIIPISHLNCKLHKGMDHLSCPLLNPQIVVQYIVHSTCSTNVCWINESVNHASLCIPKDAEIKEAQSHHRWVKTYIFGLCDTHQRTAHTLISHRSLYHRPCHHYIFETKLYIPMDPWVFCECFFHQEGFPHLPLEVFQCHNLLP